MSGVTFNKQWVMISCVFSIDGKTKFVKKLNSIDVFKRKAKTGPRSNWIFVKTVYV